MEKQDFQIISRLRSNARKNLSRISRETGIPVSTIFERLKRYEKELIRKHTALLDFSKLGYDIRVSIILKVPKENRDALKCFLMKQEGINSLYRINNGYDYLVDAVFRNMQEVIDFMETLDEFKARKECYYLLEEIKREDFMSDPVLTGEFVQRPESAGTN
ncbi:MAG: Lrp/AsnC family transcriptional regulator [Candidatus Woesearchaeota archaeon]